MRTARSPAAAQPPAVVWSPADFATAAATKANDLLVEIRACSSALGLAGLHQKVLKAASVGEVSETKAIQLREEIDSRLSSAKTPPKRQ